MNMSLKTLKNDFSNLGIARGDVVIVHSSLSSMGVVDGGAETVIEALSEVLGSDGTLLFPAFSYGTIGESMTFDVKNTPVCVGKIPETFRNTLGVLRSMHPTHSVCAKGRYANEIIKDHELDRSPMGEHSPYRRLTKYNAKILMLGCSLNSMSFMHAIEEIVGSEYCLTPYKVTYKLINSQGEEFSDEYRKHNFKRKTCYVKQCYARCLDVLEEGVDYTKGIAHGAVCYLVNSVSLHDKAILKMQSEPYYFVDLPEGYIPGAE
jgi:aminoglycoside 3-N-acetyltransferase